MAIDPIGKKISEGEVKSKIDYSDPAIVSILQKGTVQDIKKVLGVTDKDLEQFVTGQWNQYTDIIQSYPLYEQAATVAAPLKDAFAPDDESNILSEADIKLAGEMMLGKVMAAGKAEGEGGGGGTDFAGAKSHIDEWNTFWSEVLEPRILDAQVQQETLQAKANILQEIQRIMARKDLSPDILMTLAATNTTVMQGGLLVAQLGTKLMNLNKQSEQIMEWLKGSSLSDGDIMGAKQKLGKIDLDSRTVYNELQMVMNKISEASSWGKSVIEMLNSTRMEMIRKIGAQ